MAFGFGRIGCFMAHDHPGVESDFPLAVAGICESAWGDITKSCHDLGFYEAIWACSLIPIVHFLDSKKARFPGFFLALIPFIMDLFGSFWMVFELLTDVSQVLHQVNMVPWFYFVLVWRCFLAKKIHPFENSQKKVMQSLIDFGCL